MIPKSILLGNVFNSTCFKLFFTFLQECFKLFNVYITKHFTIIVSTSKKYTAESRKFKHFKLFYIFSWTLTNQFELDSGLDNVWKLNNSHSDSTVNTDTTNN